MLICWLPAGLGQACWRNLGLALHLQKWHCKIAQVRPGTLIVILRSRTHLRLVLWTALLHYLSVHRLNLNLGRAISSAIEHIINVHQLEVHGEYITQHHDQQSHYPQYHADQVAEAEELQISIMGYVVVVNDGTQQGDGIAAGDGSGICEILPQLATEALKVAIGQDRVDYTAQTHHREDNDGGHHNAPRLWQNSEKYYSVIK